MANGALKPCCFLVGCFVQRNALDGRGLPVYLKIAFQCAHARQRTFAFACVLPADRVCVCKGVFTQQQSAALGMGWYLGRLRVTSNENGDGNKFSQKDGIVHVAWPVDVGMGPRCP